MLTSLTSNDRPTEIWDTAASAATTKIQQDALENLKRTLEAPQ